MLLNLGMSSVQKIFLRALTNLFCLQLEHYTRKCRDVEEELSKKQAHIVRLKAALETETQEHYVAKQQLKKLGAQLRSAKDYMMGLDTQDEKTTDLINTICASPHPFRMASAVTLGNKSGSLLDDFEDNSMSTEGSVSTGGTEDVFMSFRKPDEKEKATTTSEADMNSTSSSAQSSSSDVPPVRRSLRKRNSSEESDVVISKKLKGSRILIHFQLFDLSESSLQTRETKFRNNSQIFLA